MKPEALNRAARQIALPQIGLDGQERIASAIAAVVGDDLACETAARALAAAGIGRLRLVRRSGALAPDVGAAIAGSNPDVQMAVIPWPTQSGNDDEGDKNNGEELGASWLAAITGVNVVVRAGFDDDPMLRAAVRLGLPVVVMRSREPGGIDIISFRRHGPCPHAPLDVPAKAGGRSQDDAGAVVAGHVAAAEALVLIAGAATGAARARHLRIPGIPTDGGGEQLVVQAHDLPWAPECFACGGKGVEMSLR